MLKPLSSRLFCQNGSNGPLLHGRETVSVDICARKLNNNGPVNTSSRLLRKILLSLLLVLTLLPCPAVFSSQANIFIYHRFNDSRYPSTNISSANFRAHLQLLHEEHFSVLSLGEVVDAIENNKELPERCAVITVDDAYRSFLVEAWPLLREFGYPVTLFVNTDTVGGGDFLSWQELKLLHRQGVEIGNHSAAHAYMLDRLPDETVQDWKDRMTTDLQRSRQAFAKYFDVTPELFAYPYGEFSQQLSALVEEAGFRAAFGQQSGVMTSGQDFFSLPRFPVGGDYVSVDEFRSKLFMKHLQVSVDPPQDTVIKGKNPPVLSLYINNDSVHEESLRCYASGGLSCQIRRTADQKRYEVYADGPITGRRGKYTLTASDGNGEHWYWFSQLWVLPRGAVTDDPVP